MTRHRVPFWQDPHFWSALVLALLPVLIKYLPPVPQGIALDVYSALVAAGVISARQSTRSCLGLQKSPEKPHEEGV